MPTPPDDPDGARPVDRRRFLLLAGAAASGLAGCSGSDQPGGGDGTTTTRTLLPTSTSEGGGGGGGGGPAATPVADLGLPAGTPLPSPGSEHAPTDGFATVPEALVSDDVDVWRVTTLSGSGAGSLREALTSGSGPRLVVFEVGGVVDLEGQNLDVTVSDVFVAGQTAPSPGITVVRGGFRAATENVVVQHLRVRPGDELGELTGSEGGAVDAMGVTGDAKNVVYDHCTSTWGSDECMSTGGGSAVTFSNNLIAEGLNESIHPDGAHSYGTLVLQGAQKVAILGNVWAHNRSRHPRLKGGTTSVVVNNLAYDFGTGARIGGDGDFGTRTSFVNNRYRAGPNTDTGDAAIALHDYTYEPRVFQEGNVADPEQMLVADVFMPTVDERPLWSDAVSPMPAEEVDEHNLGTAGARPADRTPHDERVLDSVRNGEGTIIDSQSEVGGYPDLEATERPLSVPDSGLKEWLLEHTRAVELPDASPP